MCVSLDEMNGDRARSTEPPANYATDLNGD